MQNTNKERLEFYQIIVGAIVSMLALTGVVLNLTVPQSYQASNYIIHNVIIGVVFLSTIFFRSSITRIFQCAGIFIIAMYSIETEYRYTFLSDIMLMSSFAILFLYTLSEHTKRIKYFLYFVSIVILLRIMILLFADKIITPVEIIEFIYSFIIIASLMVLFDTRIKYNKDEYKEQLNILTIDHKKKLKEKSFESKYEIYDIFRKQALSPLTKLYLQIGEFQDDIKTACFSLGGDNDLVFRLNNYMKEYKKSVKVIVDTFVNLDYFDKLKNSPDLSMEQIEFKSILKSGINHLPQKIFNGIQITYDLPPNSIIKTIPEYMGIIISSYLYRSMVSIKKRIDRDMIRNRQYEPGIIKIKLYRADIDNYKIIISHNGKTDKNGMELKCIETPGGMPEKNHLDDLKDYIINSIAVYMNLNIDFTAQKVEVSKL